MWPQRTWQASDKYCYGFNGKEKDVGEWGSGTNYDYGFRIYNPAICRFLSVDPIRNEFSWFSPYHFAGNSPISNIDIDGLENSFYLFKKQIVDLFTGAPAISRSGTEDELKRKAQQAKIVQQQQSLEQLKLKLQESANSLSLNTPYPGFKITSVKGVRLESVRFKGNGIFKFKIGGGNPAAAFGGKVLQFAGPILTFMEMQDDQIEFERGLINIHQLRLRNVSNLAGNIPIFGIPLDLGGQLVENGMVATATMTTQITSAHTNSPVGLFNYFTNTNHGSYFKGRRK